MKIVKLTFLSRVASLAIVRKTSVGYRPADRRSQEKTQKEKHGVYISKKEERLNHTILAQTHHSVCLPKSIKQKACLRCDKAGELKLIEN